MLHVTGRSKQHNKHIIYNQNYCFHVNSICFVTLIINNALQRKDGQLRFTSL